MAAEPDVELIPIRLAYAVAEKLPSGRPFIHGEVEVLLDGEETAWIETTPRVTVSEPLLDLIADKLRPLGIVWMRGWGYGGRQGRVLTANGPMVVLPAGPELWVDEGD